jgi:hypothetical protein
MGVAKVIPKAYFVPPLWCPCLVCLASTLFLTLREEKRVAPLLLFLSISWVLSFYKVWQGFIEKKGTLGG